MSRWGKRQVPGRETYYSGMAAQADTRTDAVGKGTAAVVVQLLGDVS